MENNLPKNFRQIIYRGECINSDDPLKLGRIRVELKSDSSETLEDSVNINAPKFEPWSKKDPLVYRPLLPFFMHMVPLKGEFVNLIYGDVGKKDGIDRFYIPGVYSSPMNSGNEPYESAKTITDDGLRNKRTLPLLNKVGEYINTKTKGVYNDNPDNVTFYGRGSSDLLLKKNGVLLRADKSNLPERNKYPIANENLSFIQIETFENKINISNEKKFKKLEPKHKNVKVLIDYNFINPDNSFGVLSGDVNIYNLKPTPITKTDFLKNNTNVENETSLLTRITFTGMNIDIFIEFFNDLLKHVEKGDITTLDNKYDIQINGARNINLGLLYPFYFRPKPSLVELSKTTTDGNTLNNMYKIYENLKIRGNKSNGYGLVYDKKSLNVPIETKDIKVQPKTKVKEKNNAAMFVSDKIVLLSHKSKKPGLSRINLNNPTMGVSEDTFYNEIVPKTSSMVRGEELIELIDKIVKFLISHVHPFPGMPPNPKSLEGMDVNTLLNELINSYNKVLNKDLRIN